MSVAYAELSEIGFSSLSGPQLVVLADRVADKAPREFTEFLIDLAYMKFDGLYEHETTELVT